ncbi:MAG: endonuclease/exonuclease/phosphatase family protein [Chloroflexaceae bacterium]|nr:endonuclease/exonuclease/phosphatase family protein [Chloroflexaceae bacterium]
MVLWIVGIGIGLIVLLVALVWATTFHPAAVQAEPVTCSAPVPMLQPGQQLKILTYNVQYMAGKGYVFYYDILDGSGPDERPSAQSISQTMAGVAQIIRDEDPDLVLLQEVDDGAKRTDYEDQAARLQSLLGSRYPCSTSTFYWKAAWVPHPRIRGAVGMKLVTLSKYRITSATRHQLALIPADPLTQQFNLKRAILEARLPTAGGNDVMVLNTHLEAFAQGSDTMERQVARTRDLLQRLTDQGDAWIIGGDFNLLPPGTSYHRLSDDQKRYYQPETELVHLYDHFQAVPALADVEGADYHQWYTHFPNNPTVSAPNKTIDYFFLSPKMQVLKAYVRQHDTQSLSDHLPVVVEFTVPDREEPAE